MAFKEPIRIRKEESKMSIKIRFFQKEEKLDSRAIGAGVYMVELLKDDEPLCSALPLYIGESVHMIKRCGEHLYDLFQDPRYLGLTSKNLSDEKLNLYFRVLEYLPSNVTEEERKKREKDYILKHNPITQNPNSDRQIREIQNKVKVVQNAMKKNWES